MDAQVADPVLRPDRRRLSSRKVVPLSIDGLTAPDSVGAWAARYFDAAVRGARSTEVADKIALHVARFADHLTAAHWHNRLSAAVRREVSVWREHLADPAPNGTALAPATVNAHLA
jgi:hypothetical protein